MTTTRNHVLTPAAQSHISKLLAQTLDQLVGEHPMTDPLTHLDLVNRLRSNANLLSHQVPQRPTEPFHAPTLDDTIIPTLAALFILSLRAHQFL